ncbi:hypothetical protein ACGFYV_11050 [Streptomyces sp. NPDC048297]|uniref:hypothetical protein n=1 Tax=Streptomyces sp. NPDC048297 TaxID=3365531 RepID=UPI0037124405
MSGRGRKATLPGQRHQRPPNLSTDGLAVHARGPRGEDLGRFDFGQCPGSEELRRELAAAFGKLAGREWNAAATLQSRAKLTRHFLRWAADRTPPVATAGQITPAVWNEWVLPGDYRWRLRRLLLAVDSLPSATRTVLTLFRSGAPQPGPARTYSAEEFEAIKTAAARTLRAAQLRIEESIRLLERWRAEHIASNCAEGQLAAVLDGLSRTGRLPWQLSSRGHRHLHEPVRTVVDRAGGAAATTALLFPTCAEMGAAAVLLVCHEGWNLSVLQKMRIPGSSPNADAAGGAEVIHRITTDKPRRGARRRHASNNLVDLGEGTAGRVVRRILDITQPLRTLLESLGTPNDRLLLAWSQYGLIEADREDGQALPYFIRTWSQGLALTRDGHPLSAQVLRNTAQGLYGRPRNNTQRTHDDVYLMRNPHIREASAEVVAAGLHAAVEHAYAQVRMRVATPSPSGESAEAVAAASGLTPAAALDVIGGGLDTPVAACTDFEHSPFTPAGPCAVSFLMCFACPNAVATSRHLPRIAYLHQALAAVRTTVTPEVWAADWAEHFARVSALVEDHTTEHSRRQFLAELTDDDRTLIDRMLERRLDP